MFSSAFKVWTFALFLSFDSFYSILSLLKNPKNSSTAVRNQNGIFCKKEEACYWCLSGKRMEPLSREVAKADLARAERKHQIGNCMLASTKAMDFEIT